MSKIDAGAGKVNDVGSVGRQTGPEDVADKVNPQGLSDPAAIRASAQGLDPRAVEAALEGTAARTAETTTAALSRCPPDAAAELALSRCPPTAEVALSRCPPDAAAELALSRCPPTAEVALSRCPPTELDGAVQLASLNTHDVAAGGPQIRNVTGGPGNGENGTA